MAAYFIESVLKPDKRHDQSFVFEVAACELNKRRPVWPSRVSAAMLSPRDVPVEECGFELLLRQLSRFPGNDYASRDDARRRRIRVTSKARLLSANRNDKLSGLDDCFPVIVDNRKLFWFDCEGNSSLLAWL